MSSYFKMKNEIATPKANFQKVKMHKTHVIPKLALSIRFIIKKLNELNTATNIIWSSKECQDTIFPTKSRTNAKYEWTWNSKTYFQEAKLHKTHLTP